MVHRLLAITFIPNQKNLKIVDHIDSNKKNNSIGNLRWTSRRGNSCNSVRRKGSSSKYKGVSLDKKSGKWVVAISPSKYKRKKIGVFSNEEEAALVYNTYAVKYYGEFAKLNVINETAASNNEKQDAVKR